MSDSGVLPDSVLPMPLSRHVAMAATSGLHLDLSIGGVPFSAKMTQQGPLLRGLVDDKKQQFDASGQAGENSFGYWWLRSQASMHGGAGQEYLDTGTVDPTRSRVRTFTSAGLDPFTPGSVTVSPAYNYGSTQASKVYTAGVAVTRGGTQQIAIARSDSANVDFYDCAAHTYSTVSLTTGAPQAICSDGNRVFVVSNNAIKRIDPGGSVTTIATLAMSSPVSIGFAKQRIIFGHGPALYEVDANGAAVALGAGQLKYTHPNPDWRWNVIVDGPQAIFCAGYSGPISCLYSLTETDSAGTLVLGAPIQQATLPTGERINSMIFYVNSLFALGTTNGLRIGWFTFYGQPQWGSASAPGVNITTLTAIGTVLHATTSGNAVYRFDLAYPSDDAGRYAYVCRTPTPPEPLVSLAATGTPTQVYAVGNNRVGREDTSVTTSGTVTSSWITWTTTEPKRAHYLTVSGSFPGPAGTVMVETKSGINQTFTLPGTTSQTTFEFGLTGLVASDAFRITITLNQDSGPQNVLRSWQLKALPEARRYQQIVYPLLIEDSELCSTGEVIGYPGFAADRLNLLETLSRSNTVVTISDRLMGQSYSAMIREVQFRQEAGPEQDRSLGGIATVVLTLVA